MLPVQVADMNFVQSTATIYHEKQVIYKFMSIIFD